MSFVSYLLSFSLCYSSVFIFWFLSRLCLCHCIFYVSYYAFMQVCSTCVLVLSFCFFLSFNCCLLSFVFFTHLWVCLPSVLDLFSTLPCWLLLLETLTLGVFWKWLPWWQHWRWWLMMMTLGFLWSIIYIWWWWWWWQWWQWWIWSWCWWCWSYLDSDWMPKEIFLSYSFLALMKNKMMIIIIIIIIIIVIVIRMTWLATGRSGLIQCGQFDWSPSDWFLQQRGNWMKIINDHINESPQDDPRLFKTDDPTDPQWAA